MTTKKARIFLDRSNKTHLDMLFDSNADGTYSPVVKTNNVDAALTDTQLRAADVKVSLDGEQVVIAGQAYSPVGAHTSGTNISAAVTLTKPNGASKIVIQALTKNVRFTLDGTTPTATLGFRLTADTAPFLIEVPGTAIKVIEEAATASLQYQWVS